MAHHGFWVVNLKIHPGAAVAEAGSILGAAAAIAEAGDMGETKGHDGDAVGDDDTVAGGGHLLSANTSKAGTMVPIAIDTTSKEMQRLHGFLEGQGVGNLFPVLCQEGATSLADLELVANEDDLRDMGIGRKLDRIRLLRAISQLPATSAAARQHQQKLGKLGDKTVLTYVVEEEREEDGDSEAESEAASAAGGEPKEHGDAVVDAMSSLSLQNQDNDEVEAESPVAGDFGSFGNVDNDDHQEDQADQEQSGAAVDMTCASCNAPLDVDEEVDDDEEEEEDEEESVVVVAEEAAEEAVKERSPGPPGARRSG